MREVKTIIPRGFSIQWLLGTVLICSGSCLGAAGDPSMVGWWQLNDSGGTTALDSSGNHNDATLNGNAVFAPGLYGGGVYCDGTGGYVAIPNVLTSTCTVAFWFKPDWDGTDASDYRLFDASAGDKYFFISKGANHTDITAPYFGFYFEDGADTDFQNIEITAAGNITAGTWYHVAVTWQFGGGAAILYLNGTEISRGTNLGDFPTLAANPCFGYETITYIPITHGAAAVFDDIKIFDRVLTAEEIPDLMSGAALEQASAPRPADKAVDVLRDTGVNWSPGVYAATHDVYFGTAFEDVNNASRTAPAGLLVSQGQDANTYDPPGVLQYGQTYYWRIDEVNAPSAGGTIYKGAVWSFTVEPVSYPVTGVTATASGSSRVETGPEKTVDGSGLNANDEHSTATEDGWISAKGDPQWIQYEMPQVSKLDKMLVWNSNQTLEYLFGFSAKDVTIECSLDGDAWTELGTFEFARGTGLPDYTADTTVDFAGAVAKYVKLTINSNWGGLFQQYGLSEVRFYSIPVMAREPAPTPGATNLHPRVAMSWRAGREAVSHELCIGTDPNAVADGAVAPIPLAQPTYDFAADLEKTYYWKVIEVNQAEDPASWAGPVWDFSTATYISVDDFESYTNNSPNRVFQTWIDGAGFSADDFFPNGNPGNGSGSYAGYDPALGDIMETTYFYGGSQSMPLYYDNSAAPKISEAIRTLDPAKDVTDWTKHSVTTLVVWFRGDVNNVGAPVYFKINNTKVLYNNGAAATATPFWKAFQIDLASVPASDLKNVKTLTVGVGDGSAGGSGTIFIDEIRLYATPPEVAVPTDPGTNGLEALYAMEGNVQDSSGKGHNGTANGDPGYVQGPAGSGQALAFDGINDYVDLPIGDLLTTLGGSTFAAKVNVSSPGGSWERIFDFGTGTNIYMFLTPHQGTNGTMRCAITTSSNAGESGVNGPASVPAGWHHVAVVFDDAAMQIRLYMDGALVGSGATTLLPRDLGALTQIWLGRSQWSADAYLTGAIDDFRIYNRPLSEGEVRYLAGDR